MKYGNTLLITGSALLLGACRTKQDTAPPVDSPKPQERARLIVSRLKVEADALRRLDTLALEGTAGLPKTRAQSHQGTNQNLAFAYAARYQQDLCQLVDLPHDAVDQVLEPLVRAESISSPNGGVYRTMSLHRRMARATSGPSWWEQCFSLQSTQAGGSKVVQPSQQKIVQDYQALRYLARPENRRL
jgi:hypothetical protein